MDEVVQLQCGVSLPSSTINLGAKASLVLAHGLGARNPREKDHRDKWIQMAVNHVQLNEDVSIVAYTARGHGQSRGWEATADSDSDQFTWRRLADDMIGVADHYHVDRFIAGGNSMGSATSLYAALYYPDRVKAVIMIRPPTAWEMRRVRKGYLQGSACNLQSEFPDGIYHLVLMGAADSDLPPVESDIYKNITCPVLILAHEGDDAHPVGTAVALSQLIRTAEIHITENVKTAHATWGNIIGDFVQRIYAEDAS